MKRCPKCGRDYFDDSMNFCLDDGSPLAYGPAGDESETLLLPPNAGLAAGTSPAAMERPVPPRHTIVTTTGIDSADAISPIIGRIQEIREIIDLLESDGIRLVTLTGIGGTGKTRLSKEIGRRLAVRYPESVYFVELSTIDDPAMVAPAIAHALGMKEAGRREAVSAIEHFFRIKPSLLILDNFEQVAEAGVQLAQLIRNAPGIKILVTSREALKLSVEIEYKVPPLSLPPSEGVAKPDDLLRSDAVQLFVKRARNARPDFELSNADAAVVSEICRKLDGLPLALELAAARMKILSPQEVLSKLDDRLGFLTGGARDLPGRQQTMRCAIEWSYDLLSKAEKEIFAELSVFEGGFTYNDAQAVIAEAVPGRADIDVLDCITSLTEKSLLIPDKRARDQVRIKMLAVVRDYAVQQLEQSGRAEPVHRAFAKRFLELAEAAEPHLRTDDSIRWLKQLETEHDNIRAALRWSVNEDPETAARIAASVRHLWTVQGHTREARHWYESILHHSEDLPAELRWEIHTGLGNVTQYQGNIDLAGEQYRKGLAISRELDDAKRISNSLRGIAAVAYMNRDFKTAGEVIEEALSLSRSIGDDFGAAAALARIGDIACAEGDLETARQRTIESLGIFRRLGYKQGISAKLTNLAIIEALDGNYAAAREHWAESMKVCLEIGDQIDLRMNFDIYAAILLEDGELHQAARFAGAAAGRGAAIDIHPEPAEHRFREFYLSKLRSAMDEAAFAEAFAEGGNLTVDEASNLAVANLS